MMKSAKLGWTGPGAGQEQSRSKTRPRAGQERARSKVRSGQKYSGAHLHSMGIENFVYQWRSLLQQG